MASLDLNGSNQAKTLGTVDVLERWLVGWYGQSRQFCKLKASSQVEPKFDLTNSSWMLTLNFDHDNDWFGSDVYVQYPHFSFPCVPPKSLASPQDAGSAP